jgi:hypothetical protein
VKTPRSGEFLEPEVGPNGHLIVRLEKDGKEEVRRLDEIVARAFLGEPPPGTVLVHLDGDPVNCAATNLRYIATS